jgi:hypothetical protein
MHLSIDDPEFWLLLLGGIVCGLISWGATAYDSWKREKESRAQEAKLDDVINALRPLYKSSLYLSQGDNAGFDYGPHDDHGAPVLVRDDGNHDPICPKCWTDFIRSNCGVGRRVKPTE